MVNWEVVKFKNAVIVAIIMYGGMMMVKSLKFFCRVHGEHPVGTYIFFYIKAMY